MNNKKQISLLVCLMLLGTYTFQNNIVYAQDKDVEAVSVDTDIKANKETLEKAKSAMERKDFQSAIKYLDVYIAAKPKKYEPYKLRGECYYALRQYSLAQDDFQTAIDIKTASDKFMTGTKVVGAVVLGADKQDQHQNPDLGNLYGELMYAQKALNNPAYEISYQKAFEYNSHIYLPKPKKSDIAKINCPQKYGKILNPQDADVYISQVIEDIEAEKFHEAAYKLPNIISAYPDYYLGHYLAGVVMSGMDQSKDAISSFEKSYELNPYDFESLASIGQVYYSEAEKNLSSSDAQKSIEYFNKALKLNPNCYIYYYYIGLNNLLSGNNELAITNFNSAIKLNSNDYNSMYYKLIAQHINKDYNAVIEGTTKLLYRHVSNYNSVLYLRALAYHNLGDDSSAITDIEKIFANMDDIYNSDLKSLSPKEQTLASYLYYLKANILNSHGEGTKVDSAKALSNPIIATLANDGNSPINVSSNDIENQYDYIRTTFNNYEIKFDGNEYILAKNVETTVLENSALPRIREKETENTQIESESSIATRLAVPTTINSDKPIAQIELKKSTSPEETISKDDQLSIAQMLASQSFPVISYETPLKEDVQNIQKEVIAKAQTVEEDKIEKVEKLSENNQTLEAEAVNSADIEKSEELQKSEQKIEQLQDFAQVKDIKEHKTEIVANVKEPSKEETIQSNLQQNSQVEAQKEEILTKAQHPKVIEKHAQVDMSEFNFVHKTAPEIKPEDEVIVFEPSNFISKAEKNLEKEDFSLKILKNNITDNFNISRNGANEESGQEQKTDTNTVETTAETTTSKIENISTVKEEKKETPIQEPTLITPEIVKLDPAVEERIAAAKTIDENTPQIPTVEDLQNEINDKAQEALPTEVLSEENETLNSPETKKEKELKALADKKYKRIKRQKEKKVKGSKFLHKKQKEKDQNLEIEVKDETVIEKKKFKWWWKKEKTLAPKPVKKHFSLKNIFHRKVMSEK